MISNEELGKRLKKFRKAKKITQKDMAEFCHITKNHISRMERGIQTCGSSISTLLGYAEKLDISLDELVGRKEWMEYSPTESSPYEKKQAILPELEAILSEMTPEQQQHVLNIIQKRPE